MKTSSQQDHTHRSAVTDYYLQLLLRQERCYRFSTYSEEKEIVATLHPFPLKGIYSPTVNPIGKTNGHLCCISRRLWCHSKMLLSAVWDCHKIDLHYSHKTPAVLKLLKENHSVVLYVPGRCTDEMQKCDTVVNKPFKSCLHLNPVYI